MPRKPSLYGAAARREGRRLMIVGKCGVLWHFDVQRDDELSRAEIVWAAKEYGVRVADLSKLAREAMA